MSSYTEFSKDLPKRCRDLLRVYFPLIKNKDQFEVTFLLSLASAGFTMSFERAAKTQSTKYQNEKFTDHEKQKRGEYNRLANEDWSDSNFAKNIESEKWILISQKGELTYGYDNFEYQIENANKENNPKISSVLAVIRNSLAHGNIYFDNDQGSIKSIYFISETLNKDTKQIEFIKILKTDASNFKYFLENWFDFLAGKDLSQIKVLYEDLEKAM